MEIADLDGSGTIDLEEFQEFCNRLDNSDGLEIDKCFEEIDADGSGELDVEGFG